MMHCFLFLCNHSTPYTPPPASCGWSACSRLLPVRLNNTRLCFLRVPAGNTLCKSGSIAVFGNVVYSGLLNDHLWHLGVPLFTRLVRAARSPRWCRGASSFCRAQTGFSCCRRSPKSLMGCVWWALARRVVGEASVRDVTAPPLPCRCEASPTHSSVVSEQKNE